MRLLVLEGDGIGPQVTRSALEALERLIPSAETVRGTAGRGALEEHGIPLAPETRRLVEEDRVDGVLFGATETRPGEESAVLALRNAAQACLSIRPARSPPTRDESVDVTVMRELTEGLYVQQETREGAHALAERPTSKPAVERFARMALTRADPQAPIIVAHKATVLPQTDGLFLDTVQRVADETGTRVEDRLVDALAHDLAQDPTTPATILAPNLYGDILSDVTAGLAGGLGLAGSLTLGDGPPIAEPVHGTAPDLAGTGDANPTAMLQSLALLLHELGRTAQARTLQSALDAAHQDPTTRTPDLGGTATTQQATHAIVSHLEVPA